MLYDLHRLYSYCSCRLVRLISVVVMSFFFQAEDGIRDLVRSRGLGDVYKRQVAHLRHDGQLHHRLAATGDDDAVLGQQRLFAFEAVSYTHLTLPTSDLV